MAREREPLSGRVGRGGDPNAGATGQAHTLQWHQSLSGEISLPGSWPDCQGPWLLRPRSLWEDMALPCPTRPRTHCSLVLLVLGGRGRWEARVQAPVALGA